jgi:hypothetical protein
MLHYLGRLAVAEIKKEINKLPYDGKANIKRSIRYKVTSNTITLEGNHPAFKFIEKGVRPHVMKYVANRVVPIALEDLHSPTIRDIRQGIGFRKTGDKPQHPGLPAEHFVKHAVARARQQFMDEWKKTIWENVT